MTRRAAKVELPVSKVRRYLEPGPIVLVTSAFGGARNIMTMGWHTVMELPSLVGCVIAAGNHSFELVRRSGECVINLPTTALTDAGGRHRQLPRRAEIDKFATFGLTPQQAQHVGAPLIGECHANFECKLADDRLVDKYNFFIFEVVKAHVAQAPRHPRRFHGRRQDLISRRRQFRPELRSE